MSIMLKNNDNSDASFRNERLKKARNVTILGLVLNILLAAVKITISVIFGSIALLADGLDSALDLATTILGFLAIKIADKPADSDHQFGHQKFENFFSLGIAVLLVASSGIISYQAVTRIINQTEIVFSIANIIIAVSSILLKGILVMVNVKVGKDIDSPTLIANGKNFRTDILTSIVVLISVTLGTIKFNGNTLYWLDPTIAILISLVIIFTAISITRESAEVLLDKSADKESIAKIIEISRKHEGVKGVSAIRSRTIGENNIFVDLDIYLNSELTIEEGHKIACQVEDLIQDELPVKYLQIHVEPFHPEDGDKCISENEGSE